MAAVASPYNDIFYAYQREGALRSARLLLPIVRDALPVHSVLDVGCGAGAWLRVHQEAGVEETLGIDGDYLDPSLLLIDPAGFRASDITRPLDLGRRYDLVQCLEVAEHVPPPAGPVLVDNLVRHGDFILFSAAVPGQGGKGHINERPLSYWRDLFALRGYVAFDFVRPLIADRPEVEWWYRYNTLLYVRDKAIGLLPAKVRATEIASRALVPDVSPLSMRLRKRVLRTLPAPAMSQLAALKHRQFVRALARG